MHAPHNPPFLERCLARVAVVVTRHPRVVIAAHALLLAASVVVTVTGLGFEMDRNALVGTEKRYHQNFLRLKKEFPMQDDLVVIIESEDAEKNRQFVERLGVKVEAETNLFRNVFYKGDLRMLGPKALLFVPEQDLQELRSQLREFRPFLDRFSRTTNLVSLVDMVNTQFRTAKQEDNAENRGMMDALPALQKIFDQASDALRRRGTPPSPGVEALFSAGEEATHSSYITYANGSIYLVTAQPDKVDRRAEAVLRMRALMAETQLEVTGVNVGLTGEAVLELDEMNQSTEDSILASIVALILCSALFIYGYREVRRPIKAMACLVVGLAYTLAFTTLTVGHLNILTVTFVPILIGLAIDFGVHLVTRYEEETRSGASPEEALHTALVHTGLGIFSGALTTATAFLAMAFTDFRGIQEMGIICGGGLLVCLFPMLTLLPALLLHGRQNIADHELSLRTARRARIESLWLKRPLTVVALVAVATVLALAAVPQLRFDYNLLNMQSANLPAVEYEKKLINSASRSVIFAAVVADSAQEAAALEQRLLKLPSVSPPIESMASYLVQEAGGKLEVIGAIKADLAGLEFNPPDPSPVDLRELGRSLYGLSGYLGLALDAVPVEDTDLRSKLTALRTSVGRLQRQITVEPEAEQAIRTKLGEYQRALLRDLSDTFAALRDQDDSGSMTPEDLPPALRARFLGVTGKHLLHVYPVKDAWKRENQEEFVGELRTVDPDVTGPPVQLYEYTSLLVDSYKQAAWYALAAVAIMVLIQFRNLLAMVLALVPVGLGFLWLCGLMVAGGIPFNPANIMTAPLIVGIGVANGIQILTRYAEVQDAAILSLSTGKAVLVSNLTTIAGFGSLMLGAHQGIKSLGYVMSVGVAACMIVSLTFLPVLLQWAGPRALRKKKPSVGEPRATLGREEPR